MVTLGQEAANRVSAAFSVGSTFRPQRCFTATHSPTQAQRCFGGIHCSWPLACLEEFSPEVQVLSVPW